MHWTFDKNRLIKNTLNRTNWTSRLTAQSSKPERLHAGCKWSKGRSLCARHSWVGEQWDSRSNYIFKTPTKTGHKIKTFIIPFLILNSETRIKEIQEAQQGSKALFPLWSWVEYSWTLGFSVNNNLTCLYLFEAITKLHVQTLYAGNWGVNIL